jgi:hypothetical protein
LLKALKKRLYYKYAAGMKKGNICWQKPTLAKQYRFLSPFLPFFCMLSSGLLRVFFEPCSVITEEHPKKTRRNAEELVYFDGAM